MTIQEQRRKAFEDYVTDQGEWPQSAKRNGEGNYILMQTFQAWQTWNAALDSVEIELPPSIDAEDVAEHFEIDDDGIDMADDIASMVNGSIAACGAFIRAAGLKVKP